MGKSIKLKNDIYWDIDSIRANGKPIDYILESNIFRNLLNVGNAKTSTNPEININKTNNQISINGSSSSVTNIFLDSPKANKDEEGIILKAGTYTATIKKVSGSLSGGDIEFRLRKSDGTSIYNGTRVWTQKILSGVSDDTVYSNTFTLEEETRLHWIGYFSGEPIRTFNNLVLQFQIEESPTPTSYTPWAGYIVESGSDNNGSWIKYSDGTIEEWGTYTISSNNVSWATLTTGLYYSPSYSHTLPVALINTDNINTTCSVFSRSANFDWAVRPSIANTDAPDISVTDTLLAFNLVTATNTKRNVVIRWFVKGRWK